MSASRLGRRSRLAFAATGAVRCGNAFARQAREQADDARRGFKRRPFGLQQARRTSNARSNDDTDAAPVAEQIPPVAHPHHSLHARSQRYGSLRERAVHAVGSGGLGTSSIGRETRRQPRFQICAGGVQYVARMVVSM